MKTITVNLYSFNELSPESKQKALNKYYDINVDCDWFDGTYDDAANIGLKITGFDIDRGSYCNGQLTLTANEVAQNILNDHGDTCQTYKTATNFMSEWQPIFDKYIETEEGEDELLEIENNFTNELLNDYLKILRSECEYLTSEKAIIETFEANDYTFEINGKMNNG